MTGSDQSPSDGMLIEAVLSGRRDQFAWLVRRYQPALLRLAESRLGRRDWAEDVVQETFLCAFKWLSSYNSRYSFRTWLWTILLNQCHRYYKRQVTRATRLPLGGSLDSAEALVAEAGGDLSDGQPTPLAKLLVKERRERLRELLARLPEPQADALRLRFFGELKFSEIADAMQCSLSTAKNRVRAGLETLSELVDAADLDAQPASEPRGRSDR